MMDNLNHYIPIILYNLPILISYCEKINIYDILKLKLILVILIIIITIYCIVIYLKSKKYKYNVELIGFVSCSTNYCGININYDLSEEMKSITNLLIEKYHSDYKIIKKKNYTWYSEDIDDYNKFIDKISLNDEIKIDDIHITVETNLMPIKDKDNCLELKKIKMKLRSNTDNIEKFIKTTLKKYTEYQEEKKNKKELKIFSYVKNEIMTEKNNNSELSNLIFTEKILTNYEDIQTYETFEHVFNDNVKIVKSDVEKLNDKEFSKKYGLKNKLCYLFYGGYGTGKTSFITALANEYNRHILEIPFTKIKTNEEFEKLINIEKINGTKIEKNKLIIVFDEIDRNNEIISSNDEYIKEKSIEHENNETMKIIDAIQQTTDKKIIDKNNCEKNDKINMSFILSKLDGLGNYNGLIIIATTNNIDKIHPALYRDMRMTKLYFSYMKKRNIIDMIEKYFKVKLDEEIISKLPDETDCVSGATCKMLLINNHDNIDNLLLKLYELKNNHNKLCNENKKS